MNRSRCSLTAITGLVILAILGPAASAPAQTPAATSPITIGVLAPSTGPFATYARDIIDGARLYSDEAGGQLGRRRLELVVEDYQTRPDVALTQIRKLVERDRAQAIVGLVLSAAALAVKDYVNTQKTPLLISGFAVAETLTLQLNPYVFRLTYSPCMTAAPIGQRTYRHLKARRAGPTPPARPAPPQPVVAWGPPLEEAGGKGGQEKYPPPGTAGNAPPGAQ